MAFTKSYVQSKDMYAQRVVDYMYTVTTIHDGQELMAAARGGERLLLPLLEGQGSNYVEDKRKLYRLVENRKIEVQVRPQIRRLLKEKRKDLEDILTTASPESREKINLELEQIKNAEKEYNQELHPYTLYTIADALIKLQIREIQAGNILGDLGVRIIPIKENISETKKIIDAVEDEDAKLIQ